ncbi:MAG: HesA/MoeB/ThiF family protein [archaeon YNP-WB-062]|jgi:adenylyltransferase/sulfurtransferase|nr:HesA/MoeB/ThiF family protein [Candidatus Culexarchaeum yellowstonense]
MMREYYSRQIALRELGEEGQEKLMKSKVAVVGVGGLGSIASTYLTLAGVGYIRIIDHDIVEIHNLHRQVLYDPSEVGYPKVEVAARKLEKMNPQVKVEPIPEHLNTSNAEKLLSDVNVIVDGLDNMSTRYIVNRVSIKHRIPYIFAGAIGMEGNITVINPPETPCLECIFPKVDDNLLPTCETRGVIGATPGIIGAIEAMEAIKIIAGINETLKGKLLVCDFKTMEFHKIEVRRRENCPACAGGGRMDIPPPKTTWICGRGVINVNPTKPIKIDLKKLKEEISKKNKVKIVTGIMIAIEYEGKDVSIFQNGRMIIRGVKSEDEAINIYNKILNEIIETQT